MKVIDLKSSLKPGSHLKYVQDGEYHSYVLEAITMDPSRKKTIHQVKLKDRKVIKTTHEHLFTDTNVDIADIPVQP